MSALRFEVLARSRQTRARLGRVTTPHGDFDTPAFMPVGTKASVKGLLPDQVRATGSQVILNNTYHLLLRPGTGVVRRAGGVHRFMNWDGPILTDSGGYQAFSLSSARVDDEAVTFKSIVDGSTVRLTPERAIEAQNELGADIIMALDDCPPAQSGLGVAGRRRPGERTERMSSAAYAARVRMASERTVRWLERCTRAHTQAGDQSLFAIVQGGTILEERSWCAERLAAMGLPGYAIGGVAVGEAPEQIALVVAHTAPLLPEDRPRYLMGVGYERDILVAVRAGVDMFDCVLPTRNGRNASAFTRHGPLRLRNARHAEDHRPIEEGCDCPACWPGASGGWFSRAYLRHLFMAEEMLGPVLVSLHNVRHFQRLMVDIRRAIRDDGWPALMERWKGAIEARRAPPTPGEGQTDADLGDW